MNPAHTRSLRRNLEPFWPSGTRGYRWVALVCREAGTCHWVRVESCVDEADRRERFQLAYETNYLRILGYALRRVESPEDA